MLLWRLRSVLLGVVLVWPVAAHAAVLTFAFDGRVESIRAYDPAGAFPPAAIGDVITYNFSFDSHAANQGTDKYAAYRGLTSSLKIGEQVFDRGVPTIEIQHPLDAFVVSVVRNPSPSGLDGYYVVFTLSDQAENNALTSVDLPLAPYDLQSFASKGFSTGFFGSGLGLDLYGAIDRFYAVPEPTTLLCLLTCSALLLRRSRRR